MLKNIQKSIRLCQFKEAYKLLEEIQYVYNIQNIGEDFPDLTSMQIYGFLMFSISKHETVEKHLAICDNLIYTEPYIVGQDSLILWHLRRALSLNENLIQIKSWILDTYAFSPDSLFSEDEMYIFAFDVIKENPDNSVAKDVIDTRNQKNNSSA